MNVLLWQQTLRKLERIQYLRTPIINENVLIFYYIEFKRKIFLLTDQVNKLKKSIRSFTLILSDLLKINFVKSIILIESSKRS